MALTTDRISEWLKTPRPILLPENRVSRTWLGGKLLESFRNHDHPRDGTSPEDWIASATISRSRQTETEGLSTGLLSGTEFFLRDLIQACPTEMLGLRHTEKFSADPYLLTKLLDSAQRLRIQVHPEREKAKTLFGADHGKTESWVILQTREIAGQKPYILLGFNEKATPEAFAEAVLSQNTPALEAMLHRIEVQPGDIYLVEAGTPHAIGPGVFMIEVQEPSDYTINVEAVSDFQAEASTNTLGLGWDTAFTCFNHEPLTEEAAVKRWKQCPTVLRRDPGGAEYELLDGPRVNPYFRVHRLEISESLSIRYDEFYTAIVLAGLGQLITDGVNQPVRAGDTLFVPASIGAHVWESLSQQDLKVITCHPPVS